MILQMTVKTVFALKMVITTISQACHIMLEQEASQANLSLPLFNFSSLRHCSMPLHMLSLPLSCCTASRISGTVPHASPSACCGLALHLDPGP